MMSAYTANRWLVRNIIDGGREGARKLATETMHDVREAKWGWAILEQILRRA